MVAVEMWNDHWKKTSDKTTRGGQGYVTQVVRRSDGVLGALKLLHADHLGNVERRFRMQQEANALLALDGYGVPKVLETNAGEWQDKSTILYIVMEWIEGPTLASHVNGRPQPLDFALDVTRAILDSLNRCHELNIFHRDLKPDNVILRDGVAPVLVDFGMSWTKPDPDVRREFETEVDQEIGNRFLRLPEHVPGRHLRDQRSDITLVIGLLFYMLVGQAPRALRSVDGAMPHEVARDRFAEATTRDQRWPRLRRIFNVGFQENIEQRFASTRDVKLRMDDLIPAPDVDGEEELRRELARMRDLLSSSTAREIAHVRAVLNDASRKFLTVFRKPLSGSGFSSGGGGPSLIEGGRASVMDFFIVQADASEPRARFTHRVELIDRDLVASVAIESGALEPYFRGPLSDAEAFLEAVEREATSVLIRVLRVMHEKLEHHF